ALGERVGPGRLRRSEKYFDALGVEHRVEHGGVLGVPVADEEPEPVGPLPHLGHEVAGLLRPTRPLGSWWRLAGAPAASRSPSGTACRYRSGRSCRRAGSHTPGFPWPAR